MNQLEHYGVPGMKWGFRKDGSSGGRGSKGSKKSVKSMSDKNLQAAVNRLNLERNYTRLTQSGSSAAFSTVAKTVGTIVAGAVIGYGTKMAIKGIETAVNISIKGIETAVNKSTGRG